jgi:group I intron endonuclease
MARKEKKYHYIYKTTNLLSGKYYIGMHSTDDLNDGYLGSGNRLRLAVRKHGKENFKREILEFCESREELRKREEEVINLTEISKIECMNLKVGGEGIWSPSANERFKWLLKNDEEFSKSFSKKATERNYLLIESGKIKAWPDNYSWLGNTHSEETKLKMSKKAQQRTGDKNSSYGTCWITKDDENKKIKKEDLETYLNDGWIKGRKV